jgi:hypothetical protein
MTDPGAAVSGEVAEWSNVPDSKSGVPQGTVGSNPTLSAKIKPQVMDLLGVFWLLRGEQLRSCAPDRLDLTDIKCSTDVLESRPWI